MCFFQSPLFDDLARLDQRGSSKWRITSIWPTGKPPTRPHDTVNAGGSDTSNEQVAAFVFKTISMNSANGASSGEIGAVNGSVGIADTPTSLSIVAGLLPQHEAAARARQAARRMQANP
jgi:hypothetical protein